MCVCTRVHVCVQGVCVYVCACVQFKLDIVSSNLAGVGGSLLIISSSRFA